MNLCFAPIAAVAVISESAVPLVGAAARNSLMYVLIVMDADVMTMEADVIHAPATVGFMSIAINAEVTAELMLNAVIAVVKNISFKKFLIGNNNNKREV